MSTPECVASTNLGTCIERLAAGWKTLPDLCPPCTRAFMGALDQLGGPLRWHVDYIQRAGSREGVTTDVG